MSRFALFSLTGALIVTIAACSGPKPAPDGPTASAESPETVTPSLALPSATGPSVVQGEIIIKEFEFTPATVTVRAGEEVTWTNEEDSLHTVTAGTPEVRSDRFDSGEIDTGTTFAHTFEEAGTYPFFCDRHEFMRGEVVVVP